MTDFLSGGQGGFDRLCGRCVYELKKEYPHINNYLVIPYLSFNVYDKELFDSIIYPDGFEKYNFKSAIPARNRYARAFYKKIGFTEGKLTEEFGSPVQEFVLKR